MKRTVSVVVALAATVGFIALGAAPAQATPAVQTRTLAAGNTYFAVGMGINTSGTPAERHGVLATVDVVPALGTAVGNGLDDNNLVAWQAAFDLPSGKVYWDGADLNSGLYSLYVSDPTTGLPTYIADFTLNGQDVWVSSIAIDALGNAYALGVNDQMAGTLFSLDLANGHLATIGSFDPTGGPCVAFAYNPADGHFYANCAEKSSTNTIYRVDVSNGDDTAVCTGDFNFDYISGFAFDTSGIGWTASTGEGGPLSSFDITQADCGWVEGPVMSTTHFDQWISFSNAISYPLPELPDTGAKQGTLAASAIVAGSLFALAAGAFLIRRRLIPRD